MEYNKPVAGILAAAISIIVLAGVLMPVLNEATDTHDTFANDGYFRMTKYTDEEINVEYDHTEPTQVIVNDVVVPLPNRTNLSGNVTIIASDIACLRFNLDGNFQFFSGNSNTTATSTDDWTFAASDGSATFTNTTTEGTRTVSYESLYIISSGGDWTMKKNNVPAKMNDDSFFMGVGLTSGSSSIGIVGLNVSGSIEDDVTINAWRGTGLTFTNIEIVEEPVSSHINLYSLDKITFTATNEDNDSLDITYSYFIVPYEVTAEKAVHLNPAMISVLNVIPIIIIVAVLLGVLAVFIKTRE